MFVRLMVLISKIIYICHQWVFLPYGIREYLKREAWLAWLSRKGYRSFKPIFWVNQ